MSTTVTVFNFIANTIRSIVNGISMIIRMSTFNSTIFKFGLVMFTSGLFLLIVAYVFGALVSEMTGYGRTKLQKMRQKKTGKSVLQSMDTESAFLAVGSFIGISTQVGLQTLNTFFTTLFAIAFIWLSLLVVYVIPTLFLNFTPEIMTVFNTFYTGFLSPITIALTLAAVSVVVVIQSFYPILAIFMKFIRSIPLRLFMIALACVTDVVPLFLRTAFNLVYSFTVNIIMWIGMNPLKNEIPMLNTVQYALDLIGIVAYPATECACYVLRYVIGGAVKGLTHDSLAYVVMNAINLGWVSLIDILITPTLSLFTTIVGTEFIWPDFVRPQQLYIGVLDYTGYWLQNATTIQVDIWVAGGNGTIVDMVNGTLPMPTDNYQYLIRFLQSQWIRGAIRGVNLFTLEILWQAAHIFQSIPLMGNEDGNVTAWNIDWIYNEAVFVADAFGTLLNTAGLCDVNGYQITPLSQLATLFRAVARLLVSIWNIFFGEIYYFAFNLTFPGIFMDSYLQSSPIWISYQQDIVWAGVAYGCLLAFIDVYFGVATQGIFESILIWLIQIPLSFIGRIRAIFGGTPASVLDNIPVSEMELSILKIATIGGFFFQFESGANFTTCQTRLTLFCNLGLFITQLLTVLTRLIVTGLNIVFEFIQWVTSSIQQREVTAIGIPPDIACNAALTAAGRNVPGAGCKMILVEDIYNLGCRFGVLVGNILAINVPCMSGADNFCEVYEFPNVRPNTFTKCASTTFCKVGRWLGIIPDVLFSFYNMVLGFNWNNGSPSASPTTSDNEFLVNVFKKIMYIVIFEILSFVCPIAHAFDCIWSILLRAGVGTRDSAPISALLCLITAFLVVLLRDLGEIVIVLIRIAVFILSLIFGVPAVGNSAAQLGQLIEDFFTVFGQTISKIFLLILTFALQGFFDFLSSVCNFLGEFIDDIDCSVLDGTLDSILASLGVTPIDAPENRNYKRDAGLGEMERTVRETMKQNGQLKCQSIFKSKEFEDVFYKSALANPTGALSPEVCIPVDEDPVPIETQPPTAPPPSVASMYEPSTAGPSPWGSFGDTSNLERVDLGKKSGRFYRDKRFLAGRPTLSFMQEAMLRHFGPGPDNVQELTKYMNDHVYWAPRSTCKLMFQESRNKQLHELAIADRIIIGDCIRLKFLAIAMIESIPIASMAPENIFYDTWSASFEMGKRTLGFGLVATQYFFDRNTMPENLLSKSYQDKWKAIKLRTEFYNDTLIPIMNNAKTPKEGLLEAKYAIGNMTIVNYLRRNYPSLYVNSTRELTNATMYRNGDIVMDPIKAFLDFTTQVAVDATAGAGLNANKIMEFRNATYGFFFNYTTDTIDPNTTYSSRYYERPESIYYNGNQYDFHNKTYLLKTFGPDVFEAMESYRSTKSMYSIFSRIIGFVSNLVEHATVNKTLPSTIANQTWFEYFPNAFSEPGAMGRGGGGGNSKRETDPTKDPYNPNLSLMAATYNLFFEAKKVPGAVIQNSSRLVTAWQEGIREQLESMYQAPAFETELTPAGSMIAGMMAGIYRMSGAKETKVLSPWCVAKAAHVHNMTFAQVRANITISDCPYYERIAHDKESNTFYDIHTKDIIEKDSQGNLMVKKGRRIPPKKGFFDTYLAPMNRQAELNRAVFGDLFRSITKELWDYAYVTIGDKGTAMDRMVEVAFGLHPSFSEYTETRSMYNETMKLLPKWRQEEIKKNKWVKFDDFDVHEAWKKTESSKWAFELTSRFSEAASIRGAIEAEKLRMSHGNWAPRLKHSRQTTHRLLNKPDKNRQLLENLAQRIEMKKEEIVLMTAGKVKNNQRNDMSYYNPHTLFDFMTAEEQALFGSSFSINISDLYNIQCMSSQQWLCDSCLVADLLVGQLESILDFAIVYYTEILPGLVNQQVTIMNYYLSIGNNTFPGGVAPAHIGNNRTSQPRISNLEQPFGELFQFSQSEIDNGLDWFLWFYQIIGVRIDDWIANGTCTVEVNQQTLEEALSSPNSDLFWPIIRIIQIDFGWNICGFMNTVEFIFQNCFDNIANWFVAHVVSCDYREDISGQNRLYSLAGGIVVLTPVLATALLLVGIIFYFFGALYMSSVVLILFSAIPFYGIMIYNWSSWCFPIPPVPVFADALNLWVFTPLINGPCSLIIGTFVSDDSYSSTQCATPNKVFPFARGSDQGFTNPLNVFAFARLAYGWNWSIFETIEEAWRFLLGEDTPTYNYSDYFTDPVRNANYNGFFVVGFISTMALSSFILLITILLVYSFLVSAAPLFGSFVIYFFALLKFIQSVV